MKKRESTNKSDVDSLKQRVLDLKPLPSNHTQIFLEEYPEYNNLKGINTYRNVVALGSANMEITAKMEKLFKVKKKSKV